MGADLFVSYAWTSDQHRQWVRLLAAQLKALGYDVLIDADLSYGDDLTGFMRRVVDSRHVLLIADANYVDRADSMPDSGVGRENKWIAEANTSRPSDWLSILFKDNPKYEKPGWMKDLNPKGFPFNFQPTASPGSFPGSEQIEDLWRWIEGLPANRDSATPIATLRERAARLERYELRTNPAQFRSPSTQGEVEFHFADAPRHSYTWGLGDATFTLEATACGHDSVYLYRHQIRAIGVIRGSAPADTELSAYLTPGSSVVAHVGQTAILMNENGRLAVVEILDVQDEQTRETYIAPYVKFRWRVVEDS